jgi:hypothetical protein
MTTSLKNSRNRYKTAKARINRCHELKIKPGLGTLAAADMLNEFTRQATAAKLAGGSVKVLSKSAQKREQHLQDSAQTRQWYINHGHIKPVSE